MDQVTIDLMAELDKFGGHITQIRDAIQAKGVTSEGKLFKFAEEISKIQNTNSAYAGIISYVEEAYKKGYYEYEIVDMLRNLKDRNAPLPPAPNPGPNTDFDPETATEIPENKFNGRSDLTGPAVFAKVTKVGANAFTGCGYTAVNLPQATEIDKDAFAGSVIDTLEIQSFMWLKDNLNLQGKNGEKYSIDKIVVHQDSIPPSDLVYEKPEIKIFNPDYSKKWDVYANRWVNF